MKKLTLTTERDSGNGDYFGSQFARSTSRKQFIMGCMSYLVGLTIEFYDFMGILLRYIGFENPHVTREGDTNCRMDAIIIDRTDSIPIEIKSPREVMEVNIKSIRQACENKIVLLSRKFYPCRKETTSLVIAYEYPAVRSDVTELIDDIYNSFGYNIGIINVSDLLALAYDIHVGGKELNRKYFNSFKGRFEYEKAFVK